MLDSPFLFVLLFANISEYAILGGLKKLIRQPPVNSWEYIRPGWGGRVIRPAGRWTFRCGVSCLLVILTQFPGSDRLGEAGGIAVVIFRAAASRAGRRTALIGKYPLRARTIIPQKDGCPGSKRWFYLLQRIRSCSPPGSRSSGCGISPLCPTPSRWPCSPARGRRRYLRNSAS